METYFPLAEIRNYDCKIIFTSSAKIIPASGNPFFFIIISRHYFPYIENIFPISEKHVKVFIPSSGKIVETFQFFVKLFSPVLDT